MRLNRLFSPEIVVFEVSGPDRLVQKLHIKEWEKTWTSDLGFAPMGAAEYEHGMPQNEFSKFVKSKPVFSATEVWANGYCADMYLWHAKKLDMAKYRQDLKLMATGVLARHRDPGLAAAVAARAGKQPPQRWHGDAWFDITGGTLIVVHPENVAKIKKILWRKAQEN